MSLSIPVTRHLHTTLCEVVHTAGAPEEREGPHGGVLTVVVVTNHVLFVTRVIVTR